MLPGRQSPAVRLAGYRPSRCRRRRSRGGSQPRRPARQRHRHALPHITRAQETVLPGVPRPIPVRHSTSTTDGTTGGHRPSRRNAAISAAARPERSARPVTAPESSTSISTYPAQLARGARRAAIRRPIAPARACSCGFRLAYPQPASVDGRTSALPHPSRDRARALRAAEREAASGDRQAGRTGARLCRRRPALENEIERWLDTSRPDSTGLPSKKADDRIRADVRACGRFRPWPLRCRPDRAGLALDCALGLARLTASRACRGDRSP